MIACVGTSITLGSTPGGKDGYGHDLLLERELESPVVVDATALRACHPMFLVRLRLFMDWHLAAGHEVRIIGPALPVAAGHLADMGVGHGLPDGVVMGLPEHRSDAPVLSIRRLEVDADAENVAQQAVDVLHQQTGAIAGWGDALHMGISELCDNALHHGSNELGAYIAAERVLEPRREFRLVIADLGIGIPEHIRARHPEWQDDAAAIAQVLNRGVTGTDDPQRGNGFSETIDYALEQQLVQASSAVEIDIRAASGRVGVHLVGGVTQVKDGLATTPRRGTWISYTVVTA
jgi:anti-sigma regulatory factor (Ser/Thr protein kinase)